MKYSIILLVIALSIITSSYFNDNTILLANGLVWIIYYLDNIAGKLDK